MRCWVSPGTFMNSSSNTSITEIVLSDSKSANCGKLIDQLAQTIADDNH